MAHLEWEEGIGNGGRKRADESSAALMEELQDLGCGDSAVLDGVHAVFKSHAHALGALNVGSNNLAQAMRLIASGFDQLRGHAESTGLTLGRGVHHASRNHELDDVGARLDGASHVGRSLLGGRRLSRKGSGEVAARHRDARVSCDNARTSNLARLHRVAHAPVDVKQATHGAQRGDAALELSRSVLLRHRIKEMLDQAILAQLVHKALVVHRLGIGLGSLAFACQVHMHVYEARHDVTARQVDANAA